MARGIKIVVEPSLDGGFSNQKLLETVEYLLTQVNPEPACKNSKMGRQIKSIRMQLNDIYERMED